MHAAVAALVARAVYDLAPGAAADDVRRQLFGDDGGGVDAKLAGLAATIVAKRLPAWRAAAAAAGVSLPRLQEASWRVDLNAASDAVAAARPEPRALVRVAVSRQPTRAGEPAGTQTVTFEASRATLTTLVDGMREIGAMLEATAGDAPGE